MPPDEAQAGGWGRDEFWFHLSKGREKWGGGGGGGRQREKEGGKADRQSLGSWCGGFALVWYHCSICVRSDSLTVLSVGIPPLFVLFFFGYRKPKYGAKAPIERSENRKKRRQTIMPQPIPLATALGIKTNHIVIDDSIGLTSGAYLVLQ